MQHPMLIALTRPVSPKMADCKLTFRKRQPIDIAQAARQHLDYEKALERAGCQLVQVVAAPDLPDSIFVEDCAIIFDELAIITNPGTPARRAELDGIVAALHPYRELHFILPPAIIDGGDVLTIGKKVWIGLSGRTNKAAAEQVQAILQPYGYKVQTVEVTKCLHLKSAVTRVAPNTLLLNPAWVEASHFKEFKTIHTCEEEPASANALLINDLVIYPVDYLLTAMRLSEAGIQLLLVDSSEVIKAEGGVSCCSLIFER